MEQKIENVEQVEVVEEETKGFGAWVKKHKVKIVTGVTVVGGLCLLQLTYREGYRNGMETEVDDLADVVEETLDDVVGI